MTELLYPIPAGAKMSDDMAEALMLLAVEYSDQPEATLTEEQVRDFIRTTPFSHVVDDFRDYYLLFAG
jgi:hypothetical protein